MLLPESMSRIVIVGSTSRLDETIEALYDLKSIHLIDYFNDSDAGFSIGAPRPYSSKASERLLKIRAVEKELGIDERKETYPISAEEIRRNIDAGAIETMDKDVFRKADERNKVAQTLAEINAKKKDMETLSALPVPLELYRGYDSIIVSVGTVKADPSAALAKLNAEVFLSADKKLVAVFAAKAEKEEVQRILSEAGYMDFQVPEGTGMPQDNIAALGESTQKLGSELEKLNAELAELAETQGALAAAADEELSILVQKGETPLRIATSDFSFVVDAWVPTPEVGATEEALRAKLGDSLYISTEEKRGRSLHDEEHAEKRFKKVPTKMKNGNLGKQFEFPTTLVSIPKYQEIDPSAMMAVLFPIFFGFMVGDVGYAIPFIILGAFGLKTAKSQEFRGIATILFFGGLWAFIFGFFFFGDMLGMHFVSNPSYYDPVLGPTVYVESGIYATGANMSWEMMLGVQMPDWFTNIMIHGHGITKTSPDWVPFLLKLSVYIGILHIVVSYLFGIINIKMQHGMKAAFFEKGGWLMSFLGLVVVCYVITEIMFNKAPVEGMLMILMIIGAAVLITGTAVSFKMEKIQAILELPGLVGNILSYTRLVAVGMSKAGMAMAFNYLSFIMILGFPHAQWGIMIIFAALIFLIGHLTIWTLAIISAGLHGLRLQYVESMNKFFVGGGEEYAPLSVKRKHTKVVETEV